MPIIAVMLAAILFGGMGFVVGGGIGALAAELLHQRLIRQRESLGAEVQPEESYSGCQTLLVGFIFGGVLGCGAVLGLASLVVAS